MYFWEFRLWNFNQKKKKVFLKKKITQTKALIFDPASKEGLLTKRYYEWIPLHTIYSNYNTKINITRLI